MKTQDLDLFKDVITGSVYPESAWRLVSALNLPTLTRHYRTYREYARVTFLRGVEHVLKPFNVKLVIAHRYDALARAEGRDWPLFGYSMIGRRRLDHLQVCVETVIAEHIEGDFIETGVWRGGAAMLMKAVLDSLNTKDRVLWLADTFTGLPPPQDTNDGKDMSNNKFLAVDSQTVETNFTRFGLMDRNVKFLVGLFADTLPRAPITKLALLRLDGDLYYSTYDSLKYLYPKVSAGGFVIVDDYFSWPGCRLAVHDYLASIGCHPQITRIDGDSVYWRTA